MSTKLLIKNFQSPGDILMITAAVKDLRTAYPNIRVNVITSCPDLWTHNPFLDLSITENTKGVRIIDGEYKLIHKSGQLPYHFIHGFRMDFEKKLDLIIPPSCNTPCVFFDKKEIEGPSIIERMGHSGAFWILNTGGKKDYTAKWWNPHHAQEVVDHFAGDILFVQVGAKGEDHWHPPLRGVVNLIGKTTLREMMILTWHSQGIICPVTMMMHLSAAIPSKYGGIRPCIVTAGGREPVSWEAYNGHFYLSKVGALPCSMNGPCWKSKTTQLQCKQEIDEKRKMDNSCEVYVELDMEVDGKPLRISKCLDMTTGEDVVKILSGMIETERIAYGSPTPKFRKSHLSRG